ncbi:hypothetical protein F5B17DRAFT_426363 [Nemania serpens]|nr:hypothetical protein F5B17DRAFT_426363 [Nemania serpens]
MQIKFAVLISLGLSAVASPIIDANGKITGPRPYKIFNSAETVQARDSEKRDSDGKITGPRPYKIFNSAETIKVRDEEKRDNPKIIGPRPYKIFN